jgi:DNA-binding NarL/FixJ family response regulator
MVTQRPRYVQRLTSREWQVVNLVTRGWSNWQVAVILGIKESTVKTHLSHIFQKLGIHQRSDMSGLRRRSSNELRRL